MRFIATVSLLLITLSKLTAMAWASENESCLLQSYVEVHSLVELPSPVRQILHKDLSGLDELVDHEAEFSSTDVGSAPRRRFALAAVSESRILVVIEHGGRGYSVELWDFVKSPSYWHGEQRQSLFAVPHSSEELILNACK